MVAEAGSFFGAPHGGSQAENIRREGGCGLGGCVLEDRRPASHGRRLQDGHPGLVDPEVPLARRLGRRGGGKGRTVPNALNVTIQRTRHGACPRGKVADPRGVDLERAGGRVVIPRWPELARGRLRQRGRGEAGRPAGSRSREGAFASALTGGQLVIPRTVDLERVGGRVVVPRRPELARWRLRQRGRAEAGRTTDRSILSGWVVG